eukprot:TRINITY_DN16879_c0_g1_i1.p1 TRINITY_DN16879_c0_g1~~TRINITY_DN16879_c0_g1_i1.p1  ORF type:complete len:108 (-),score=1.94 TRINITY_DN16879_c0_g1_i1:113-436(-)
MAAFSHTRTLSFLDAKAARYAATTTSSMRVPLWFVLVDDDVYLNVYNWAYSLEPHTRILYNSYETWSRRQQNKTTDSRCRDSFYGGHALTFAPVSYTHLTLPTKRIV